MNLFSMELNRRLRDWLSVILFLLGNIATLSVSGHNTGLDCSSDYEVTMSCHIEAQNCAEYRLTIGSVDSPTNPWKNCNFTQCGRPTGRCCCSANVNHIFSARRNVTVLKGSQIVEYKIFNDSAIGKPNAPTNIRVKENNGNFLLMWTSNVPRQFIKDDLTSEVTYYIKGGTEKDKEIKRVKQVEKDGDNIFEIPGKELEPRTIYVFSVRSKFQEGLFSDSSEEYEFKTPASHNILVLFIIISLSIFAAILSGVIYCCYVKFKAKWWDSISDSKNPRVLLMHSSEQEVLKPKPPIISSICVEPFIPIESKPWSKGQLTDSSSGSLHQSSGISTGSSSLSYANTEPADIIAGVRNAVDKAFANFSPMSPVTSNLLSESNKSSGLFSTSYNPCSVRADDVNSGSSGFDNKTYSILIAGGQTATDSSENQTQAEVLCDSAYHPSEGDMMTCHNKQELACVQDIVFPPVASSLIPIDMSYQGNADSGRFSYAEDSSLSSISSSTNTTASCDLSSRVENFDEVLSGATKPYGQSGEVTVCDDNPCYNCMPANMCNILPVDDNYQAFQTLVKPPDVLNSEQRIGEEVEHFDRYPEKSSSNILQGFLSPVFPAQCNGVQGGQCPSQLQSPFLTGISAGQSVPIITESGYQSV